MRLSPSIAILRTQTDERLVELARLGSEPAFAAIVERHRREMLRACARLLPDSRAEDAAQQAFIAAWVALKRGDAVIGLRAWLMTIARHTALNALRVQGYDYDELRDSLGGVEAPQSELERRDVMRQTLTGVAALPARQREVLLRSAVEGTSHADIAREMGLSDGAARQLVMRARANLRAAATALMPTPVVAWASSGRVGSGGASGLTHRIGELVTTGGAGAGAWAAKAGVVTLVAGSVAVAPAVIQPRPEHAKVVSDPPARTSPAVARRPTDARPAAAVTVTASAVQRTGGGIATGAARRTGAGAGAGASARPGSTGAGEEHHSTVAQHKSQRGESADSSDSSDAATLSSGDGDSSSASSSGDHSGDGSTDSSPGGDLSAPVPADGGGDGSAGAADSHGDTAGPPK